MIVDTFLLFYRRFWAFLLRCHGVTYARILPVRASNQ